MGTISPEKDMSRTGYGTGGTLLCFHTGRLFTIRLNLHFKPELPLRGFKIISAKIKLSLMKVELTTVIITGLEV